jgi:hypothetical protein
MKSTLLFILSCCISIAALAKGTIRGSVIDEMGQPLMSAIVQVKGTTIGTVTDLDGEFSIAIESGVHDIEVKCIGCQPVNIEGITVKDDEVSVLNNIQLKPSGNQLEEVVVKAEAIRTNESALIAMKRRSTSIMDGISADQMKLVGDGTAIEASKRVTGVSIEDGKYIYVRGLGDRYTRTTLNGIVIPGLDPDKNSLQMDIFPTNLIDNIIAHKNFSADLPADFTGGLVDIETKAFPEQKIFKVSIDAGYNPQMHLNADNLTYKGGKTDFLGFDDGTRALPATDPVKIPTPVSGASKEEVNQFVKSFNPELGVSRATSPVDYGAGLTLGNQYQLKGEKKRSLGYIFSLSYKKSYTYYDDVTYGEYQRFSESSINDLRYATIQKGEVSEDATLLGGLAGLAYKTQKSKFRLTGMRLQSGTKRAGLFNIDNDGAAVGQSGYKAVSHNLEYNQRSLTNAMLAGDHTLGENKWQVNWKLSPTWSTSNDPDIRKTAFTVTNPDNPTFLAGAGGNPSRIWRYLDELNATAKVDVARNYKIMDREAVLKFGGSHTYKQRDYEILFFDIQFLGTQSWSHADPNQVLNPENIYPNTPNNIYYQSGNLALNPNAYSSNVNNTAFYVSNEMSLLPKLKTVLGVRAENYVQRYTGADQKYASGDTLNGSNLENEEVLSALDFFPSANFIYALTDKQNIRLTYGRTIARPSFKELSFAQILDPITNRIFNGSLFTYPDWNGKLTSTLINNLDLRWEMFMERSELVSVSAFYKGFNNAIELVRIPTQQTSTEFQARNVGNGQLYGAEFELRKELGFISPFMSNLLFSGNVTLVKSQIQMTNLEYTARKEYERDGQTISNTRDMAGQSPYVINAGLSYMNQKTGLNAGMFYNVKGPTLYIVGVGLYPDVYAEPFHSLNFSLNKSFGKDGKTVIDFKISNLLNDRVEKFYQSYQAQDQIFDSINPGRAISLGVSHNF